MIDDKQTADGIENATPFSDQSHSPPPPTKLSEAPETSVERSLDRDADNGANWSEAPSDEGPKQDAMSGEDAQPPAPPFETIRDTTKAMGPTKAAKGPPTPEEKALRWLEAAASLVRELPHDPRWPVSIGERSFRARLWIVRDKLNTFTKRPPREFCLTAPGPSARKVHSLFGQVVGAIHECRDTTEEVPKAWAEWNAGKRETVLKSLLD